MITSLRNLMLTLLEASDVTASWGITNVKVSENSLCFDVCGLKFKGSVLIYTADRCYDVCLDDEFKAHCDSANIVSLLDSLVEVTGCYEDDLRLWIGKYVDELM